MSKNRMIELTQISNGTPLRKVYLAKDHIVAVYPVLFKDGGGCYVELSTNNGDQESIIQVEQSAHEVVSLREGLVA